MMATQQLRFAEQRPVSPNHSEGLAHVSCYFSEHISLLSGALKEHAAFTT